MTPKTGGYKGAASLNGMIESGFAYVKFTMSIGIPRADLEEAVGHISLDFRGEIQPGYQFGNY